ncbi:TPA: Lar family restriction alleviation protein [Pseudomonas aeruginosa]
MSNDQAHSILLPCPFCGSEKISYSTHQIGVAVGCDSCGATCEIRATREQCASLWNRRAAPPIKVQSPR